MASRPFRTKLCRNFALGHCPQGDQCKYLHSTNAQSSQMSTMSPPVFTMAVPAALNPHMFFNPVVQMTVPWPAPLSSPHHPDFPIYNWMQVTATSSTYTNPQTPQYRPLSWRTSLCRHFIKNQGWCPLGDDCGYIHDLSLAHYALDDVRFPAREHMDRQADSHTGADNSRPLAGSKHSHCWAYVQGLCRVQDCPYLHPIALHLFIPHTPCLAWPNCTRGALCAYKHPEPLIPKVPELNVNLSPVLQAPPSPPQAVPAGTVQYHGTTYFPTAHHAPPPPRSLPSPQFSWNPSPVGPGPSAHSGYSPYSVDSLPFHSPYYETVPSLPPVSVMPHMRYLYQNPQDPASTHPVVASPGTVDMGGNYNAAVPAEEFPYRAPDNQSVGHARRVSVTLKSKEDSDALGITTHSSTRRESWMGHGQRDGPTHRSWPWAPESSNAPLSAPPDRAQFVL